MFALLVKKKRLQDLQQYAYQNESCGHFDRVREVQKKVDAHFALVNSLKKLNFAKMDALDNDVMKLVIAWILNYIKPLTKQRVPLDGRSLFHWMCPPLLLCRDDLDTWTETDSSTCANGRCRINGICIGECHIDPYKMIHKHSIPEGKLFCWCGGAWEGWDNIEG